MVEHMTAVFQDGAIHGLEEPSEQRLNLLRIHGSAHRRIARNIGEQDRCLPALTRRSGRAWDFSAPEPVPTGVA